MTPEDHKWLGQMIAGAILAAFNALIMLGSLHAAGYKITKRNK